MSAAADWRAEAAAIANLPARADYLRGQLAAAAPAETDAVWWALADVILEAVRRLSAQQSDRLVAAVGEDFDPWEAGA